MQKSVVWNCSCPIDEKKDCGSHMGLYTAYCVYKALYMYRYTYITNVNIICVCLCVCVCQIHVVVEHET